MPNIPNGDEELVRKHLETPRGKGDYEKMKRQMPSAVATVLGKGENTLCLKLEAGVPSERIVLLEALTKHVLQELFPDSSIVIKPVSAKKGTPDSGVPSDLRDTM